MIEQLGGESGTESPSELAWEGSTRTRQPGWFHRFRRSASHTRLVRNEPAERQVADKSHKSLGGDFAVVGFGNRVGMLVTLLVFQSASSVIIFSYQDLIASRPVIVAFLTMLVGAGGNAGNQSAVLVVRSLATGEITGAGRLRYLIGECRMALAIALVLSLAGYVRVVAFGYGWEEVLAICISLFIIVISSIGARRKRERE